MKNTRSFTVAKTSDGIYTVSGDILPIQIIDNRQLAPEENVWLKNLSNKLNYSDVEQVTIKIAQKGKSTQIKAYAYAVANANLKALMEEYMSGETKVDYGLLLIQFIEKTCKEAGFLTEWEKTIAEKDAEIKKIKAEVDMLREELAKK